MFFKKLTNDEWRAQEVLLYLEGLRELARDFASAITDSREAAEFYNDSGWLSEFGGEVQRAKDVNLWRQSRNFRRLQKLMLDDAVEIRKYNLADGLVWLQDYLYQCNAEVRSVQSLQHRLEENYAEDVARVERELSQFVWRSSVDKELCARMADELTRVYQHYRSALLEVERCYEQLWRDLHQRKIWALQIAFGVDEAVTLCNTPRFDGLNRADEGMVRLVNLRRELHPYHQPHSESWLMAMEGEFLAAQAEMAQKVTKMHYEGANYYNLAHQTKARIRSMWEALQ